MTKGIRLHPEHGLNPTIPTCLFCGNPRDEVALLGAAYEGRAPQHLVIDTEPCDNCKAEWARGIALIEANADRTPTGAFIVVTEEGAKRLFNSEMLPVVLKTRKCLVEIDAFEAITKRFLPPDQHDQHSPSYNDALARHNAPLAERERLQGDEKP